MISSKLASRSGSPLASRGPFTEAHVSDLIRDELARTSGFTAGHFLAEFLPRRAHLPEEDRRQVTTLAIAHLRATLNSSPLPHEMPTAEQKSRKNIPQLTTATREEITAAIAILTNHAGIHEHTLRHPELNSGQCLAQYPFTERR